MTAALPSPDDDDALRVDDGQVEALWVHGLLRGLAESPRARTDRLQEFGRRLRQEEHRQKQWRARRRVLVSVGLAAAVLVCTWVGLQFGSSRANAETLLRRAQQAHQRAVDYCYLVQWEAHPGVELLARSKETHLWTRGDRFWISANRKKGLVAYGQDANGSFWVAHSPRVGVRFEASESDVPEELFLTCAICSMRMETLLSEVLHDFDLRYEPPTKNETTQVVVAKLKSGHNRPSLLSVRLEIDHDTHVIRKLILERPQATVTYTLSEIGSLSDDQYTLEGHLEPGAQVFSRRDPELRRQRFQKLRNE